MLKDILDIVEENLGGYSGAEANRANLVRRINTTALLLHTKMDLVGSLDEEVIQVSTETNLTALPPYMGKVRMLRLAALKEKVNIMDLAERYHTSGQTNVDALNFKMMRPRALSREIDNASRIIFSLSDEDSSESITLYVTGKNDNSNRLKETIVLTASGKTSVNVYSEVFSIKKSAPSTCDVIVKDVEGNVLALIPNDSLESLHQVLQIQETNTAFASNQAYYGVEILYKKAFVPMVEDTDSFLCGDIYDPAIAWSYILEQHSINERADGMRVATVKLNEWTNAIASDNEKGLKKTFDKARNKYYNVMSMVTFNGLNHGYRTPGL